MQILSVRVSRGLVLPCALCQCLQRPFRSLVWNEQSWQTYTLRLLPLQMGRPHCQCTLEYMVWTNLWLLLISSKMRTVPCQLLWRTNFDWTWSTMPVAVGRYPVSCGRLWRPLVLQAWVALPWRRLPLAALPWILLWCFLWYLWFWESIVRQWDVQSVRAGVHTCGTMGLLLVHYSKDKRFSRSMRFAVTR